MLKDAQTSMQEIAGFLLSGDNVTEAATETGSSEGMISVAESAPEIPEKRKRGRPPRPFGAMTVAERARRYRQKHRPACGARRVELWASTVERGEKLAAEHGTTVASVIDRALREEMIHIGSSSFFRLAQAAAERSGEKIEVIVADALSEIRADRWNEIADSWIRYRAEIAAIMRSKAQSAANAV